MSFTKGIAIGMRVMGANLTEISAFLNVSVSTVSRWWQRFQDTGSVLARNRPGRSRKTSARADRNLVRLAKKNQFAAARVLLQQWNENVSRWTVYRRLRERGLQSRRPFRGPLVTQHHRNVRLQWAMQRVHWSEVHWGRIV